MISEEIMSRKKKRHRFAAAMSRFTELPVEALCAMPVVTIKGRDEVEITGCRGILRYEDERVTVKTADGDCTVTGQRLILSDFRNEVLYVRGEIDGIHFDCPCRMGEGD